uniref:Uncharacterized protein n=1 Tax=Arundo donax TaxID=35708 RepID=A0A0A9AL16_ARUDO
MHVLYSSNGATRGMIKVSYVNHCRTYQKL